MDEKTKGHGRRLSYGPRYILSRDLNLGLPGPAQGLYLLPCIVFNSIPFCTQKCPSVDKTLCDHPHRAVGVVD
jgi:hypothetical protein